MKVGSACKEQQNVYLKKTKQNTAVFHKNEFQILKKKASRGVWLNHTLMRTQESTNPAVSKGNG